MNKNNNLIYSARIINPLLKDSQQRNFLVNNNNNQINIPNNSDKNILGDTTGIINPIFNFDEMLNEMSKILFNLKSDMNKVMIGINQLNTLVENIQKYKTNNNMMNNNMNNLFNNNMNNIFGGGMNNLINNNMNTLICGGMNNLINNNMNNINQMINNMNQHSNNLEPHTVIFREFSLNPKNREEISVKYQENEKISEIIQKFRNISSNNKSLEFKFNAKILNPTLTAKDAGLYPNAYIIYK